MRTLPFVLGVIWATAVAAGLPVVENVTTIRSGNTVRFDVTIRHGDDGWDHYADGWGVYAPNGTELGYRILHHPHVTEQPFTRSLTVEIPEGMTRVIIIPRDSVHGMGQAFEVEMP